MKREYFTMLFMLVSVGLFFLAKYFFGYEEVTEKLGDFIVIWLLIAYQVGQYSSRFPKAF